MKPLVVHLLPEGLHAGERTFLVNDIPVGLLPNGTIYFEHNDLGSLHLTARNFDATTAPLIEDCTIIVGHGDRSLGAGGKMVLVVDDTNGNRCELNGKETAEIIHAIAPDIAGHVFLNVCRAGEELDGFARQMADTLNRTVRASPEAIYTGGANEVLDPPWYMVPTTSMHQGTHVWFDFPPNDTRRVPVERRDAFIVTETADRGGPVLSLD